MGIPIFLLLGKMLRLRWPVSPGFWSRGPPERYSPPDSGLRGGGPPKGGGGSPLFGPIPAIHLDMYMGPSQFK